MNMEAALQEAVTKPDFLCVSGSRLYGTNRPTSDNDYRGFTIPPIEYLLGVASFNDMDVPGADHKVYSLKRFLDLIIGGDPQCSELLFAPQDKYIFCSSEAKSILALRPYLISNKIYSRIVGYGYSEFRKAMGVRLEINDRTKTEDDVINDIRNLFHPSKEDMDEIINVLFSSKPRTLVPSLKNLGEKRKKEFDLYGFGVSSAAHAIRLTSQVTELMLTGNITLPRPNAEFLLNIRQGKVSKEDAEKLFNEEVEKAHQARDKSVLPDKPNVKEIHNVYLSVIKNKLINDERFKSL